jgi:molybdopterin-guanine dinucleotide biosynthesis protein A
MKLAACYTVFNGVELLEHAINSVKDHVDEIIIGFQTVSNYGNECKDILDFMDRFPDYNYFNYEPDLKVDSKTNEKRKHQQLIEFARSKNCTHFFLSATDHFYKEDEILYAINVVLTTGVKTTYSKMITYFKEPTLRLEPLEEYYMPFICSTSVNMGNMSPVLVDPACSFRPFAPYYVFKEEEVLMHHFSWIRKDIRNKLENAAAKVNWLDKIEDFIDRYNNFKLGDRFPYYPKHRIVETEDIFNLRNIEI